MKLSKMPKGKVTVDKLLRTDDLAEVLLDLEKERGNIEHIAVIFEDKDGDCTLWSNKATYERINWMLDWAKRQLWVQE